MRASTGAIKRYKNEKFNNFQVIIFKSKVPIGKSSPAKTKHRIQRFY